MNDLVVTIRTLEKASEHTKMNPDQLKTVLNAVAVMKSIQNAHIKQKRNERKNK